MQRYVSKIARKLKIQWKGPLSNDFYARTSIHAYTYTINRKLKIAFQKSAKASMEILYTDFNGVE